MYSGAVAAVVLMFLYYTGDFTGQCKLHEFFISFNMLVCIALSVISIMPKVQVMHRDLIRGQTITVGQVCSVTVFAWQEHMPQSGLLQSSMITLYMMYLTWSAVNSSPSLECKPDLGPGPAPNTTITTTPAPGPSGQDHPHFDTENIVGLVIWFLCVLYSSITTSNSGSASKLTGTDRVLLSKDDGSSGGDVEAGTVRDNEQDEVSV